MKQNPLLFEPIAKEVSDYYLSKNSLVFGKDKNIRSHFDVNPINENYKKHLLFNELNSILTKKNKNKILS